MCRITILELFPLYHSARKWGLASDKEIIRLEKDFTVVKSTELDKNYTIDNKPHRKDGPSKIWYRKNGQLQYEAWFLNGKRHRLPHCIQCGRYFCSHGQKYLPTVIEYYENNQILSESWWMNNKRHRKEGYAEIYYHENGNKRYENWWNNGKMHQKYKPAKINYYENGQIKYESWWLNDLYHHEDGPAIIEYDENGNVLFQCKWLHGQQIN